LQALIDGIGYGLVLCILVGPILFALIQTGIERGARAGLMVGLGIWISDFIFIGSTYFGISYVAKLTQQEGFELYLGIIGGLLLMSFGIGTILSKAPNFHQSSQVAEPPSSKSTSYLKHWVKGFLINTVNPFTFFFWIGIMTTVVAKNGLSQKHALLFLRFALRYCRSALAPEVIRP